MLKRRYEPVKRRLYIKNNKRFLGCLLGTMLLLAALNYIIRVEPRESNAQNMVIEYQVTYGDTYWQIAKDLQAQGYKPRTDIRKIVDELTEASGIPAHELKDGDTIYIPNIKEEVK